MLNNPDFNSMESHGIKNSEVPYNRFTMTPNRWKKDFNAIGIIPSSGRSIISNLSLVKHNNIALKDFVLGGFLYRVDQGEVCRYIAVGMRPKR